VSPVRFRDACPCGRACVGSGERYAADLALFEFMKSKGLDCPGIKIRENAIVGKDASSRSTAVLEYKKLGYKGWKQMHQYGRR